MKVLNYGSLNYDNIYQVDHFVKPKETLASINYDRNYGGKGLNQSIALAKAGVNVYHAGKVGYDGQAFIDYLNSYGIDTRYLIKDDNLPTGHAIIQVCNGENCIILFGGSNKAINKEDIDKTLSDFDKDDLLLIQNEISSLPYLIKKAHEKGMMIAFNVAPFDEGVFDYPLDLVDILIVNEVEGKGLAKVNSDLYKDIINGLKDKYPNKQIILTCGKDGAYYINNDLSIHELALSVKAIDTTAAGDTFTGYFLAMLLQGKDIKDCLSIATKASSITIQSLGAAQSIPNLKEVINK